MTKAKRDEIRARAVRVQAIEKDVLAMDDQQCIDWFMSKPGHLDAFTLAVDILVLLDELDAKDIELVKLQGEFNYYRTIHS